MISAIIVDDEEHGLERLARLLAVHCPDKIRLLRGCGTVEEGVRAIRNLKPDLVFLDIQLHDLTGFDLLRQVDVAAMRVIFTTAYHEYAVTAFRFSAIDYLLKPIGKDELVSSVDRAMTSISTTEAAEKYETLLHNLRPETGASKRICLPTAKGFDYVDVQDIVRCQANGNYTVFFLKSGSTITVARTLKVFESMLADHNFFRVHHAHLINLDYVARYHRDGQIVLSDNSEVEVSVRRKEAFLKRMASGG